MSMVAIDPGVTGTGWALYGEGRLIRCGYVTGADGELWERAQRMAAGVADGVRCPATEGWLEAVVEKPQVYQQRSWKGDPNDLIDMAIVTGAILHRLAPGSVRFVAPREWKGQVPKPPGGRLNRYVVHRRTCGQLCEAEWEVYRTGLGTVAEGLQHNIADAVGIALWANRRSPRSSV